MNFAVSTGLINQVDSLVGQEAVADVAGTGFYSILNYSRFIGHVVVLLIFFFQSFYDADSLVDAGLLNVDLLETAYHSFAT